MLRPPEFAALLSIQLTAAGGVFSLALSGAGRAAVLLILPLITYMLAGRHVAHSYASASIGTYIRVELSGRVRGGLGWEQWLQTHRSRPTRRNWTNNPLLITFPGISILALLGALPYLATLGASATAGMLWLSWVLGVALTSASTRILWKVRTDSFLLTGPASDSG